MWNEKKRILNNAWSAKNKEKVIKYKKEYYSKHKEKFFIHYKRKQLIMHNLKINGCAICGYDECDAALDFHHVNPKDKKYGLSAINLHKKDFIDEINKCILLCCRCHKEIENGKVIDGND